MATNYPGGLDNLTNPDGTGTLATSSTGDSHSTLHADERDAIDAIQAELGLDPAGSEATVKARIAATETVADAALATPGAWATYTPTLTASGTDPTLSDDASHTATGAWTQMGKTVIGWVRIVFGTSGVAAGSGNYYVGLPVAGSTVAVAEPAGTGYVLDASANFLVETASAGRIAVAAGGGGDDVLVLLRDGGAFLSGTALVSAAVPWTWADSDQVVINFAYEAA